jgi:Cu/Ag efflux protein CusF
MRAWKAVVVVNLALLVAGVLGGWQVWRRTAGPAGAQAGQAITWGGPEREWRDIHGVVRALIPDLGIIVLTHADIPGFMPGMTMGFRMATPQIPETLSVGDAVRFTVRGSPPLVVLTAIEKTS